MEHLLPKQCYWAGSAHEMMCSCLWISFFKVSGPEKETQYILSAFSRKQHLFYFFFNFFFPLKNWRIWCQNSFGQRPVYFMESFSNWKYLHLIYKVLQTDVNTRQPKAAGIACHAVTIRGWPTPRTWHRRGLDFGSQVLLSVAKSKLWVLMFWNHGDSWSWLKPDSQDPFPIISSVVFKYQWKSWGFIICSWTCVSTRLAGLVLPKNR